MKKSDVFIVIVLLLVVSFSFYSVMQNKSLLAANATEEISSSSTSGTSADLPPTGEGEITTLSGTEDILLSDNFTGIWKAMLLIPQASSSGDVVISKVLASVSSPKTISEIIAFKLCVMDGKLEGYVQQGGVLNMGVIINVTPISEEQVEFDAQSKDGTTKHIIFNLAGERECTGAFLDGHEFTGRKLSLRGCTPEKPVEKPHKPTMSSDGMSNIKEAPRPPSTGMFGSTSGLSSGFITETGIPASH